LDWLDQVAERDERGNTRFTYYYEMGTNTPLYTRAYKGADGKFHHEVVKDPEGAYPYGLSFTLNLAVPRQQLKSIRDLSREEALDRYWQFRRGDLRKLYNVTPLVDYR